MSRDRTASTNQPTSTPAFPTDRADAGIRVDYEISDADWKLTVSDNGVGKTTADVKPTGGLGTAIVGGWCGNSTSGWRA